LREFCFESVKNRFANPSGDISDDAGDGSAYRIFGIFGTNDTLGEQYIENERMWTSRRVLVNLCPCDSSEQMFKVAGQGIRDFVVVL